MSGGRARSKEARTGIGPSERHNRQARQNDTEKTSLGKNSSTDVRPPQEARLAKRRRISAVAARALWAQQHGTEEATWQSRTELAVPVEVTSEKDEEAHESDAAIDSSVQDASGSETRSETDADDAKQQLATNAVHSYATLPCSRTRADSDVASMSSPEDNHLALGQDRSSAKPRLFASDTHDRPVPLSTVPSDRFCHVKGKPHQLQLVLKKDEVLCFYGEVAIQVTSGCLQVGGARLDRASGSQVIYAPISHPLPLIKATKTSQIVLETSHSGLTDIDRLPSTSRIFLPEKLYAKALLPNFHPLFMETPNLVAHIVPPHHIQAVEAALTLSSLPIAPRIMTFGAKGSGKSTFCRLLCNCALSRFRRVAYLDADPGQSEIAGPGTVSLTVLVQPLLGPPFSHILQSEKVHFVGGPSASFSPSTYLAAVEDLLLCYENLAKAADARSKESKDPSELIPLVINTHGWIKGLGWDLLQRIAELSHIRTVVSLQNRQEIAALGESSESLASGRQDAGSWSQAQILTVESVVQTLQEKSHTASELRALKLLAHLHIADWKTKRWNFRSPLWALQPRCLDYLYRGNIGLQNIYLYGEKLTVRTDILKVLDGSIVSLLCVSVAEEAKRHTVGQIAYDPGADPPCPASSQCLGFALVRSIDALARHLHIVTSLPWKVIKLCNAIAYGAIEVPLACLTYGSTNIGVGSVQWRDVPYLSTVLEHEIRPPGSSSRKTRKNLRRRAHM